MFLPCECSEVSGSANNYPIRNMKTPIIHNKAMCSDGCRCRQKGVGKINARLKTGSIPKSVDSHVHNMLIQTHLKRCLSCLTVLVLVEHVGWAIAYLGSQLALPWVYLGILLMNEEVLTPQILQSISSYSSNHPGFVSSPLSKILNRVPLLVSTFSHFPSL